MDAKKSAQEIETWLVEHLVDLTKRHATEISVDRRFDEYGVDSAAALGLTGELELWLDRPVKPSLIFACPTIRALARRLADG